jgi:nitrate/TMAO reductase-like tetraheme cytochrome c subunit
MQTFECKKCHQTKERSEFYPLLPRKPDKPDVGSCKTCQQDAYYLKKYNVTRTELNKMKSDQNGQCKICQSSLGSRGIHLDHNHETGHIRGLLCPNCNKGIGLLKDDPTACTRAAVYLANDGDIDEEALSDALKKMHIH